ncbi:MAG: response regulator transcription factor [Gemmatimonadaceae bacterium]|nr:response regulator transcription factor [Chitinophagaceae bacterium]
MRSEKFKILIVDDSEIIKDRVSEMLGELENVESVTKAGSFDEAVSVLSTAIPDILLLDINLPDKSGIDLLRHINENAWKMHVIMVSNQANSYYRSVCKKLGATDFVDKSADFDRLPQIISGLN